ncbi:DUF202 domain-containing protein [Spirulina subsalsa FACHB-351]|uniref:DUF202 domain-containing protein n=1 Tax=Spirulina subsalsa FACHB-351 TaxID=234711 RepID=A0ABT3L4H5_9CYAN|nr:DUF202 domain-containing protein [Spirulina subsalsa]MCW6036396.1 DUF202 domain-containing protein [Spirulina subsalsa FACHB-351]
MTGKPPIDRQREHQANERTFLAWIRTALAMIGIGLAIARFGLFLRQSQYLNNPESVSMSALGTSEILGLGFILTGLVLIPLALWNYGRISEQIETGQYTPNPLMVWLTAGLVMGLGVLSIPFLLLNRSPNAQQSPASYWREGIRESLVEKPLEVLGELERGGERGKPS